MVQPARSDGALRVLPLELRVCSSLLPYALLPQLLHGNSAKALHPYRANDVHTDTQTHRQRQCTGEGARLLPSLLRLKCPFSQRICQPLSRTCESVSRERLLSSALAFARGSLWGCTASFTVPSALDSCSVVRYCDCMLLHLHHRFKRHESLSALQSVAGTGMGRAPVPSHSRVSNGWAPHHVVFCFFLYSG